MAYSHEYASSVSTGFDEPKRTLVNPVESIGRPDDTTATAVNSTNSLFAMVKGCASGLGVAAGSGDAVVNASPRVIHNPVATLGERTDTAAADVTGAYSAIALCKGILAAAGV